MKNVILLFGTLLFFVFNCTENANATTEIVVENAQQFAGMYSSKDLVVIIPVIVLLVYLLILYFRRQKRKKELLILLENFRIFKQKADKIEVNLTDCILEEKIKYEQVEKSYKEQRREAFDGYFLGYQRDDTTERYYCLIKYKAVIDGIERTFTTYFNKDKMSLYILLAQQETTYIYVDKRDREEYYFDLEFLVER